MSKNQKSYCGMLIKEKMLSQLLKLNKEQLKNVMDSCIHYFKGENTDIPKLDQIEEMICSMMFEDIRDNKINYISSCLEKRKASWKTHHKERIENGEIKDEYLKDFLLEYLKDLDILDNFQIKETVPLEFLDDDAKVRSYLRGAFLATGSVNNPETSRYHLEIYWFLFSIFHIALEQNQYQNFF